jgi:hypothetical protein
MSGSYLSFGFYHLSNKLTLKTGQQESTMKENRRPSGFGVGAHIMVLAFVFIVLCGPGQGIKLAAGSGGQVHPDAAAVLAEGHSSLAAGRYVDNSGGETDAVGSSP